MKTKTKKRIVDPKQVREIAYNNPDFLKGFFKVKAKIKVTQSNKTVDDTKLHYRYLLDYLGICMKENNIY